MDDDKIERAATRAEWAHLALTQCLDELSSEEKLAEEELLAQFEYTATLVGELSRRAREKGKAGMTRRQAWSK